jgi:hypothetical protein
VAPAGESGHRGAQGKHTRLRAICRPLSRQNALCLGGRLDRVAGMGAVRPPGGGRGQLQTTNGRSPCDVPRCPTCRLLRAAAVALALRRGIQSVTSEGVAAEAGIEPEQAAKHYPTLDHCLSAAYN